MLSHESVVLQSANAISGLLGEAGAARAGAALGVGQALSGPFNLASSIGGMAAAKNMGLLPVRPAPKTGVL